MALTARTFFVLVSIVLHEFVITATSQLQSTSPNSSLSSLPLPVPLPAPLVVGSKNKFVIRKCCGPGQLYNYNAAEDISDADRCVKFSVSSSQRQLPAVKRSREIFLGSKKSFPPRYSIEDVQVDVGFPRSCTPDALDFLEPEKKVGDLFYALSSGLLLVPHQFYFLEFDSYCIEDYADERNVTMARRMAFMCFTQTQDFPTTAIDSSGKLRLDFVKSEEYAELFASKFNGRRVIRKCCRQNATLDSTSEFNGRPRCRENQGLVTPFFENLQLKENSTNIFFRLGYANCSYPVRTTEFQLHSNGSLEIKLDDTIANSSSRLVSIEDYCLDDMVQFNYFTSLPFTSTYALYCPGEEPSFIEPEFSDGSELTESPFTDTPFTDPPFTEPTFTDTTISEPESTYSNNDNQSDNSTLITIPKCCPPGHVMSEDYTCQPLWWWPTEQYGDEFTEPAVVVSASINYDLMNYHNNLSVILIPNATLSSCKAGQLQQAVPLFAQNSKLTPIFRNDSKNGVSVSLHAFVENYWDVKSPVHSFCVDQLLFKEEQDVYYNAQVFYCVTIQSFSSHRPVILLISVVGLLATFIIYLFVPASGSAKLVVSAFGGKKNRGRSRKITMAMMLTGRILLCHIISLALAFTCLAIGQLKLVESLESSCVALGYITYWALIASFSWLTVYCFDYYYIFNGSFKVTNDGLFIPYSAFGWGVPFLATIITIIAQFKSTSMGISGPFNPNFGYDRCWFPDESSSALIIFFYVPVGILLLLDIYFFLSLMFNANLMHCWQRQDIAIRSNRKNSTASKEQEDLKMAVKLFFITGIPWIFELFGYLTLRLGGLNLSRYYFFEFCVILNTSRGIFIFVNFILMNRDVRSFLWSYIKFIFKREPLTLDRNVTHRTHTDNDLSTSHVTTSVSTVTCTQTISNVENSQCDEESSLP